MMALWRIATILIFACMAYPQPMQSIPANVQLAGFKSEFAEVNGTRLHYCAEEAAQDSFSCTAFQKTVTSFA